MKKTFLLISMLITTSLNTSQQGPMNAEWFYSESNPFKKANDLHQERKWQEASDEYKKDLSEDIGDEYDQKMARLNLAACLMAQRQSTEHWASLDTLLGISEKQQISEEKIKNAKNEEKKSVLVITKDVGIGDIFHFLKGAHELKKRTGWDVILSIPNFLKDALSGATNIYGLGVVGAKDEQPKTDHTTHLIALLGHLKMNPLEVAPEDDLFTAPERAVNAVNEQIESVLSQGKTIAVVFLGENRQATVLGGKQIPRDIKNHGRHLDSEAFKTLLKLHPNVVVMDCDGKNSRFNIDENQKDQYMQIAPEQQPFDTLQALALAMNVNKKIIGFGADNGPTNVFARTLNKKAQRRMALIIPNGSKENGEYDMRMEGQSSVYTQMISNCPVYKCETPDQQTEVIETAYQDMNKDDDKI